MPAGSSEIMEIRKKRAIVVPLRLPAGSRGEERLERAGIEKTDQADSSIVGWGIRYGSCACVETVPVTFREEIR